MPVHHRWFRSALHKRIKQISGKITLRDSEGVVTLGRQADDGLSADVTIHSSEFYARMAVSGTVGAAEAYMDGLWDCADLTRLVRILVRNREALMGLEGGLARLSYPLIKAHDWLRPNTRRGSRRNIAAHYDLGNDFYQSFLDETLMYSCAFFEDASTSLLDASHAKNERICRKLGLESNHRVLDIGGGWGGFALHAAREHGCHVTMTTISAEQHRLARERVAAAGLEDRIEILSQDYRDLEGEYDRIVSIEMIEAVGHQFYSEYFGAINRLLRPEGAALIQAIVVQDRHYDEVRRGVDFIKRYIFPGSCLPSVGVVLDVVRKSTDLRLFDCEDMTEHYARTLSEWCDVFLERREEVRALGYDEQFLRMWEFYLRYCEGGFAEHFTGLHQWVFAKPRFGVGELQGSRAELQ